MKKKRDLKPWLCLEKYRGRYFNDRWPSLPQLFDINTERFSGNKCFEAFSPEHIVLTYAQARERIIILAGNLVDAGVRRGDRVGLTGKNSPEWAVSYLAVMYAGAVVVPVDYSLSDAEIEHLLDFAGIKGLIIDGERFDRIGRDGKYGFKFSLEQKGNQENYVFSLCQVKAKLPELPVSSDIAAMLFTSGTTGVPKAVVLTHENLVSDCFLVQSYMNLYETDVFYAVLPIHHAYTMLAVFIESISCGANLVFCKKLTTNQIFREMKQAHVTMFLAVPMLYNKIIASVMKGIDSKGPLVSGYVHVMMNINGWLKKYFGLNIGKMLFRKSILSKVSLDNNRICISGGGPLPPETFRLFNKLGIDFVQGYGLTETSPILTLNPVYDYEERSIGKIIPEVQVRIDGSDDCRTPGEILVKGPMVMRGYYNNEEATSEVIDSEGWFHTGDVGYIDERGFVYLTGRKKNIIVTEGGKNVFPEEIEDLFQLYDDIDQVCVLGYTENKDKSSESVCVLIYPSQEYLRKEQNPKVIKEHFDGIVSSVNENLLPYKRIRKLFVVDEPMEMTSTKKIKRFAVIRKYGDIINDK